ncbi:TonB-dependent receptor [Mucilaginibacter terrigena]|uniref:TonB-dependent receptor n=1 Tax=Mucilaginibacter terrigena TaxID=2492395 RepID=A0A4Q5LN71_9SPHI|nr:TonB-dependent receptor [Mucilaginibacter terrigena]RYU90732.1 TonB-dependent receptor [Mucilaginibacter terrigena]
MCKKPTLIAFFILLSSRLLFAQTGIIKGTVRTIDGAPAESVSIALLGTTKGASTDKDGSFQLKNIDLGTYTVVASFVGLERKEQVVTLKRNQIITIHFVLKENSARLNEVVISARKSKNKVSTVVAKMPLKNLENPQVYNTVSSEIIKQQGINNYDDVMRNVPGISQTWQSTGRAGDGGAYFALRGFDAQPVLTNGLPALTGGNLDLANVEEVQVIKGPSATLFGGSFYSYGGVINTITKKPYFDFGGEVAYNIGSFGLNRATIDLNTPLSKTEKIALRINTSYQTENSFQNAGFKKSFFISPAITYEVNNRLKLDVMAEITQEKRAVAPVFFQSDRATPLPFKTVEALNLNVNESFTSNDLTMKNPRFNIQAQANYKLSDQWNSQTVISAGRVKSDGYYTYIFDDDQPDNFFPQDFHIENNVTNTFDIQQNFNGDFKLFGLRNRILVGVDYYNRKVDDNGSGYATVRYVTPQGNSVDYTYPSSPSVFYPAAQVINKQFVDSKLAGQESAEYKFSNSSLAAYASDVINFTPKLSAMLSLRVDNYTAPGSVVNGTVDFSQFALSHKLGLVYQPVLDKVSVFANYMDAFINVEPSTTFDNDGNQTGVQNFKPEHANQWEVGVKTNLFSDRLSATLSYYNIKVSDRVYSDLATNTSKQGGKVRSKGFEVDVNANVATGFNLIAGYSHNSNKVLAGDALDFYNEPGRSSGGQGPSDQANLWATYKFAKGAFKNFGLGVGGNYAGEYIVIDNSVTGQFILPGYTLLNGSMFYNSGHYRVNFNVNNITNEQYYIGYWSINPQKLRNFNISLAYKF